MSGGTPDDDGPVIEPGSVGLDSIASYAVGDSLGAERSETPDERTSVTAQGEPAGDAGRFRIGPEIGAGGTGRVSLVRDLRLLRDIAWKRGDWRLLREARILAQLEHPGIVPIHDMGFDPDGQAFFAMRVVRGRSLSQVLRATPSAQRESLLRPLLQAAEAVAYAHHRGVVHRDLKPANIMIGRFGESQVVDWGLARVLDEAEDPLPHEVREALSGHDLGRVGTPGYMSPEQQAGQAADRRSDVFSLGRILARIVLADDADPSSAPAELRAIAHMATDPDPGRRYPDAAAFAADLGSHLDGRRVSAHTYGQRELLRRFVRNHRLPLAIVAVGLIALIALGVIYVLRVGEARDLAEHARERTEQALRRSDEHLARSLVGEARRQLERGARAEAEVLAAHALSLAEDADARGILASLSGAPALELVSRAPLPCDEAQVDPTRMLVLCVAPEGVALWTHAETPPRELWRHEMLLRVASLVEGGVVIGSSLSTEVLLLDLAGRELLRATSQVRPTRKMESTGARALLESAKHSALADVARREIRWVRPCDGMLHGALALGPEASVADSPLAAIVCKDGRLRRPGRDEILTELVAPDREAYRIKLIDDGRMVVGTTKGEVLVLDDDGRITHARHLVEGMVRMLEPSPDQRRLLVAGEGDPIAIVTLPDLARLGSLPRRAKTATWAPQRPDEMVTTGAFLERWRLPPAHGGRPLRGAYMIPLADGVVALDLEPDDGERLAVAHGPAAAILDHDAIVAKPIRMTTTKSATLLGPVLYAAGIGGFMAVDSETLAVREPLLDPRTAFKRMITLADGTHLIATYGDVDRVIEGRPEPLGVGEALDLAVSYERRFAAILVESDRTILRVHAGGPEVERLCVDPRAEAIAISADGERLFTAHREEVAVWSAFGTLERMLAAGDTILVEVAISADGRWVAAGARDGAVLLWDLAADVWPRARFADHDERVPALAFSNDSRWLVSGSWDRTLRVRDLGAVHAPVTTLVIDLTRRYGLELEEALGGSPRR